MDVLHVPQGSVNQQLTEIPSSLKKDNKLTIAEDPQVIGSYPGLQQLGGPHFAGFSNLPALLASSHHPSEVSPVGSSPDAYSAVSLSLPTLTTPPITGISSSRQTKVTLKAPKGKKSKHPAQRKCTRTKCPMCPRTFPCPADMRRHRLSDHDNVRFQCPHSGCPNRKYTRYDALLRHDTSKHLGVGRPVEVRSPGGPKASPGPKRKLYADLRAKRDARDVEADEVIVERGERAPSRDERAERRAANRALEM
ncbi:hypothetical protein FIBSPDRAFT_863541 [Athelia psychrophila]|uniref:C2H2-type domain-containing protein n=1 Tax=Athelia psychrophila TaxID=1759441 RepID=A0A166HDK7_9AGAM|nr:hypothetical protein FIBSPDRAFT_863541 [Fibularhizoctonia sp. CBS 109695]